MAELCVGVWVIDGVFSAEECAEWRTVVNKFAGSSAQKIVARPQIAQKLWECIAPHIKAVVDRPGYRFVGPTDMVTYTKRCEPIARHTDNPNRLIVQGTEMPTLEVLYKIAIYLSEPQKPNGADGADGTDGGTRMFVGDKTVDIAPKLGRILIFDRQYPHEGLPHPGSYQKYMLGLRLGYERIIS